MKKHLQVVGAVIVQGGKVLAAKRGESKYPYVAHKYEFVGGKIEAVSYTHLRANETRRHLVFPQMH